MIYTCMYVCMARIKKHRDTGLKVENMLFASLGLHINLHNTLRKKNIHGFIFHPPLQRMLIRDEFSSFSWLLLTSRARETLLEVARRLSHSCSFIIRSVFMEKAAKLNTAAQRTKPAPVVVVVVVVVDGDRNEAFHTLQTQRQIISNRNHGDKDRFSNYSIIYFLTLFTAALSEANRPFRSVSFVLSSHHHEASHLINIEP